MKTVLQYIGGRVHRRLFFGFGITIFVTFFAVGLIMHSLSFALPSAWDDDMERLRSFVGRRFAEVWTDPEARRAFAQGVADELRVQVELRDVDGRRIGVYGPECAWRRWKVPVPIEPAPYPQVRFCKPGHGAVGGLRMAIVLAILGSILWLGSGLMARRITRPLRNLTYVTRDIGAGRFGARAEPHGDDELGVLAGAVNEMAGRIQTQIEDQRQLLATVSHELRTPLGHLRLLAELAQTEDLPVAERQRALTEIDAEIQEMDALVGELLAHSRLDFQSVVPQPLHPKDLACRALERAGLSPDLVTVQDDLPEIHGDATLVARALSNLIRNAQSHGGGVVHLSVARRDEGVAFEVQDAGPGIPDSEREAVFRPFHRAEGGERGTLGLGLALVARIAEVHGGRAYVEDAPKVGIRVGFTCRLTRLNA